MTNIAEEKSESVRPDFRTEVGVLSLRRLKTINDT